MKTLKSIAIILMASMIVGVFTISCEKNADNPIIDEQQLSEEELVKQLNSDEVALNYVNALEEGRDIIRDAVIKHGLSSDRFRAIYTNEDKTELNTLFEGTRIMEVSSEMETARQLFVAKYPNLDSQFSISEDAGNTVSKSFHFLDQEVTSKGCRRWSRGWWKSRACAAACVGGGAACSFFSGGWGSIACAIGGYACVQVCYAYFC
jgi:hypothetical protein